MQKRSKKAVSIMTRPSRGNAVVLKDFCASAFSMALLHRIKEALPANENFAGPVLKGGALLAEYMRLNFPDRFKDVQPADYDFSMNLVQVKMYPENGVNGMIKSLAQHGFSMQEMEADNRRKNPEILDFNNKPIITLRLLFDGKKVDLVLAHRKCTAPYVAAEGDTAVSSIAVPTREVRSRRS